MPTGTQSSDNYARLLFLTCRHWKKNSSTSATSFADDEAEQSFVVGGKEITAKLLAEALHSLPEEKRETVLLYYFFDMSEREIAKFCNLSRTTVQSRRTSSMKLLKRYLEEKAYDCTD